MNCRQSWLPATILLAILKTVNVQFAMPMPMFAPPPPPPPPMVLMAPPPPPVQVPVGVPYPVPVPVLVTRKPTTTTTTTTTTEAPDNDGVGVAIPFPFVFPMPFVVPQAPPPRFCADKPRPKQCPPCPPCVCAPSCTPSFYSFCSPCHQKCRCKNGNAPSPEPPRPPPPVPLPPMPMMPPAMPMPMYPMQPAPPPVFVFPLPPAISYRRPPRTIPDESCDRSDRRRFSDSESPADWRRRRRRKHRIKRYPSRNSRKTGISLENDDDTGSDVDKRLVKPMLSYISEQGEVKFQKRISEDDANKLMRDTDIQYKEVGRRFGGSGKDSRKVIFSPPPNKSISNLTVSFNVV